MAIDRTALLAHLAKKAEHRNILIHSVLAGLMTAIERGDFDTEADTQTRFDGYFIAASDLNPSSTSVLWDGEVHLTKSAADKSVGAITAKPDWYQNEDRTAWAVYGLTNLDKEVT